MATATKKETAKPKAEMKAKGASDPPKARPSGVGATGKTPTARSGTSKGKATK